MPAFQPYWGKPAVRNDRGDRGNVGIIRSPVRASILPDRARWHYPLLAQQRHWTGPTARPVTGRIMHIRVRRANDGADPIRKFALAGQQPAMLLFRCKFTD